MYLICTYCNSIFSRFGEHLEENLPKLDTLIMTNNNIQELADIETLSTAKTLTMLSLLHNPVVAKPNYRLFVIHRFPNLRVLDFKKVKVRWYINIVFYHCFLSDLFHD